MDHGNLIRQLGGAKVLADDLRARGVAVKDVTVRSWCLAGRTIPDGYWLHVKAVADAKGVPCTFEALAQSVALPSAAAPADARPPHPFCATCSPTPGQEAHDETGVAPTTCLSSNGPRHDVALCGACDLRAEDPAVRSCTDVNCPMRQKEAA